MAIQRPSRVIPDPIAPKSWARNGRGPSAALAGRVLRGFNHCVAHRRKLLFSKALDVSSIDAGDTDAQYPWRTLVKTGLGASGKMQLVFHMIFAPTEQDTVFRRVPYIWWEIDGTPTDSLYSTTSSDGSVSPDTLQTGTIRYDVDPDTEYELVLVAADWCRPVACVVYEEHSPVFDSGDTGTCDPSSLTVRSAITTAQSSELLTTGHELWKANAGPLFAWSTDLDPDDGGDAPAITSASLVPIFEGSGSPSAASVGWRVQARYHNAFHSDDVPVIFAVCAAVSTSADVEFELYSVTEGASKITLTSSGLTTSPTWIQVAGAIDGTLDTDHLMVRAKTSAGTLTVYAITLLEDA